jgi:ribosome-binding protein aMBF1 (putative translation factor)
MATSAKPKTASQPKPGQGKRLGRRPAPQEEVARLRAEVARLRAQVRALQRRAAPALPAPDAEGNYPAAATLRAILAQQLVRRRQAAGWTQAELAVRAGVRQETVSRLESGKHAPNVSTVDKLDRALQEAGV